MKQKTLILYPFRVQPELLARTKRAARRTHAPSVTQFLRDAIETKVAETERAHEVKQRQKEVRLRAEFLPGVSAVNPIITERVAQKKNPDFLDRCFDWLASWVDGAGSAAETARRVDTACEIALADAETPEEAAAIVERLRQRAGAPR